MRQDDRGTLNQSGQIMYIDNALVEEVSVWNRTNGYVLLSYAVPQGRQMTAIELLRLNVGRNTVLLNSFGINTGLKSIHKGMRADVVFSRMMTRSIPPQSNAFMIAARRESQAPLPSSTSRISSVDVRNNFIYTGNPNNINSQTRYSLANPGSIRDIQGNPVNIRFLHPGQKVLIVHADFQTASIPPQTTAYYVQLLNA